MKVIGLITEYNPFHNGHIYHIREAQKMTQADLTIAIMSGNFTQRGEASLIDKFVRAKEAVKYVDLVVELPLLNAVSYADDFALGGVHIAGLLNVDEIVFGSESGEISSLQALYRQNQSLQSATEFQQLIRKGYSHPRALAELTQSDIISGSNNILGLSYIKAIDRLKLNIKPSTIKRIGNDYNDTTLSDTLFSSATSLRESLLKHDFTSPRKYMPGAFVDILSRSVLITNENFFDSLKLLITHKSETELRQIYMMTEGIENRLKTYIRQSKTYREFLQNIKTKRYTWTRLNRLMTYILLNITKEKMHLYKTEENQHVRVLAMNGRGRKYLKTLPETTKVITNVNKENREFVYDEITAADIYNIASQSERNDFNTPVIIDP